MDVSETCKDSDETGLREFGEFSAWLCDSIGHSDVQYVDSPCSGNPPSHDGADASEVLHVSELPFQNSGFDERNVESVCPSPSSVHEATEIDAPLRLGSQPTVSSEQWELGVAASFGQFAQHHGTLLLPWETGVFSEIFGTSQLLSLPNNVLPEPDSGLMDQVIAAVEAVEPSDSKLLDSCYDKAVKNLQDLEYFENKHRQLELACGQWLELLSCSWYATGVGEILSRDMQKDTTGSMAFETLKACFGIKSPQTLLKRASSFEAVLQMAFRT